MPGTSKALSDTSRILELFPTSGNVSLTVDLEYNAFLCLVPSVHIVLSTFRMPSVKIVYEMSSHNLTVGPGGPDSIKMDQTQVMVGNFPWNVRAQDLAAYLQRVLGIVDRCKVKRISGNTPPHAFVQFVSAAVAREACRESEHENLSFEGCVLKIIPCTAIGPGSRPSHGGIIS